MLVLAEISIIINKKAVFILAIEMKKFTIYTILFISSVFILNSCKKSNPFYGVADEDTEGPSITVTYPSTSTTITGVFNFKGTAADKGGNEVYKIEVSTDGGTTWKEASGTVNWVITIDPFSEWGVVTSAARTILVRATDTDYKKNTNTVSVSYTLNNTNPNLVGAIADILDTVNYDGTATTDGYHSITEGLNITYQWEDDSSFTGGYKVTLYDITGTVVNNVYDIPRASISASCDAGTVVSSGITGVSGNSFCLNGANIEFTFTGTSGKKYYASVKGYDSSLAEGSATSSVVTTLDNAVPVINIGTINFLANSQGGGYVHDTSTITFTWTNSAASDGETGIRYFKIYITGTSTATYTTDSSASSYTASLSNGTYSAEIKCVDMAGNESSTSVSISNFVVNTNTQADVGTISDNSGDQYYNATEIATRLQFSWTNLASISGYDMQVVRNDGKIDTYSPSSITTSGYDSLSAGTNTSISNVRIRNNSGTIEFEFTPSNGYTYQVQVKAYNSAGTRSSSWVSSQTITIDTTVPTAGTVTDGGTYSTTNSLTFTWSGFSDSYSGIASYNLYFSNDNGTSWSTASSTTANTYTGTGSGTYTDSTSNQLLRVCAVDKAGNEGCADSDGIIVDTVAPSFTVSPNSTVSYTNGVPTWTITPTEVTSGISHYEYNIKADGSFLSGTTTTSASAVISVAAPTDGTQYELYVRAVDNAGNTSAYTTTTVLVYDVTAPPTPTISSFADSGALTADLQWSFVTDTSSPIATYEIYIYDNTTPANNATVQVTVDSATGNLLSLSVTAENGNILTDGSCSITQAATGSAFNVSLAFTVTGSYRVQIKALDTAGNDSGYSAATTPTLIN